jgi:putative dimethyl sulfoxide reductase chaperone
MRDLVASWSRPADDAGRQEEYERLFVGPGRAPCPPYESLWRGDAPRRERGRLMGDCAADVSRIYGALGLQPKDGELPDHIALELEAYAFAVERGEDEAAETLVEHLAAWVPGFCEAVEAEARQPYYAELARQTSAWVAELAA